MSDDILALSAVRRVASRAGALRFNKAIGQIIGSDATADTHADRSVTLTRLLTLYNRMRAATLYGQEDQFKAASAEMADAVDKYSQRNPGGADRLRKVIAGLTFTDEKAQRAKALAAKGQKPKTAPAKA